MGDTTNLITNIVEANNTAGPDTLVLSAGCVYTLYQAYQINGITEITSTFGKAGLPAITSTIIISGQGATIQRALTATNDFTGSFRLMTVGQGGDFTLYDVTLKNGLAQGGGGAAAGMGGAIFNALGRLALERVTLLDNIAQGGVGGVVGVGGFVVGGGGVGGGGTIFPYDGGGPNGGGGGGFGFGGDGGFGGGGGFGFG
ncbi:MAG: hypothetical protein GY938_07880, partial [Ketobacter sp.]|nr:hypothetical protein [Ketobacter sp.]